MILSKAKADGMPADAPLLPDLRDSSLESVADKMEFLGELAWLSGFST